MEDTSLLRRLVQKAITLGKSIQLNLREIMKKLSPTYYYKLPEDLPEDLEDGCAHYTYRISFHLHLMFVPTLK